MVALGLIVVAIAVAALQPFGPTRHADGAGPLASYDSPSSGSMSVDPSATSATSWTYGVPLCISSGDQLPVLEDVQAHATVGAGFVELNVRVRNFVETKEHTPIISVDGYPPPESEVPDPLQDVHGFTVSTRCGTPAQRGNEYTELLVGLERVGDDGGGWQGIDVSYTVGGRPYVLSIDYGVLICGRTVMVCGTKP